jgi:hypothetical protein
VKRLPTQVREKIELDGWNRCEKIEQQEQTQQPETLTTPTSNNPAIIIETDGMTNATTLPAARPQTFIQSSTTELLNGQANLSKQMNEQFIQLSQQFSQQLQSLVSLCQGNGLML